MTLTYTATNGTKRVSLDALDDFFRRLRENDISDADAALVAELAIKREVRGK